jgi:glycosyltransferase involved in cell wall biosynthesis
MTGLQSWNFRIGSNPADMARVFARDNKVLFINYALDRLTWWRKGNPYVIRKYQEAKADFKNSIEQILPGLYVFTPPVILESINQVGPLWLFDHLNRFNSVRFAKQIRKAMHYTGFSDFILFTDSDFYRSFWLPELLHPSAFIYYIRDNMIATDYYRKHGRRMEKAFIAKADLVVANSGVLAKYAREFNKASFDVGQGCDLTLYDPGIKYGIPEDFAKIREKFRVCVGYTGALRSIRIDEQLLIALAEARPGYAFVLVGPEDDFFKKSRLHTCPNVFFLGNKPENTLPAYLSHFDVAINPQALNSITNGNYPRKIDEYLAMGIPAVATETETMKTFADHVYLAHDPGTFIEMVDKALQENTPELAEKRKELVKEHTWEKNIGRIYTAYEQIFESSK